MNQIIENIINEDQGKNTNKKKSRKLKYPCSICSNSVMSNQKAVQCDHCELWVHTKCEGISNDSYLQMEDNNDTTPWECSVCKIKYNEEHVAFTICDGFDLENLNNSDSMKMFDTLPNFEIMSEISKFSTPNTNDIDFNLTNAIDCKYYSIDKFHKHQMEKEQI